MRHNRFPALAGAALVSAGAMLGIGVAVSSADDVSNYDGTKCGEGEFFDASAEGCATSVVTNDADGVPQPQDIGANYDGTRCQPGQFYDASQASCVLSAVTNDAQNEQALSDNLADSELANPAAPQLPSPPPGTKG